MNNKLAKLREEFEKERKNCINQMREWKNTCDILYRAEIMHHSSDIERCGHRLT
jgi:hypothetical protein